MKKTYQKPEIMFENFLMSTNIAGDCGELIDTKSENACAYVTRTGLSVFTSEISGICTTTENDDEYNGFCYHVPTDGKNLFNS